LGHASFLHDREFDMNAMVKNALTKAPSSTVTWAALAGFGMAAIWGGVDTFTAFDPSTNLVGPTVALASGVVGKLVPERRYQMVARK